MSAGVRLAMMRCRPLLPGDAAWAGALAAEAGFSAYRPERLGPTLALERSWGVAAFEGPRPAGFALLELVPPEAELHLIAVSAEWRGQGVGALILRHVESGLRERGVDSIFLEVSTVNRAARALYAKAGFQASGLRRRYYADGSDAWLLVRRFTPDPGPI